MDTHLPQRAELAPNTLPPLVPGAAGSAELAQNGAPAPEIHGERPVQAFVAEVAGERAPDAARERNAREAGEVREMLGPEPNEAKPPPITKATVRVMRSHDYCHFEVCLSTEVDADPLVVVDAAGIPAPSALGRATHLPGGSSVRMLTAPSLSAAEVDALRKQAARLVDKAIAQFQVAKKDAQRRLDEEGGRYRASIRAERIREIAEGERTPEQQAELKAYEDMLHHASREPYDYQDYHDDWDDREDDARH